MDAELVCGFNKWKRAHCHCESLYITTVALSMRKAQRGRTSAKRVGILLKLHTTHYYKIIIPI